MPFRLYLVPIEGTGTRQDPRRPKYFSAVPPAVPLVDAPTRASMPLGKAAWMVVGTDLSFSDDLLVVGQSDVFAVPFDMSVNLTAAQVTNVQNKLESINVPAGWVNTGLTWIEVVRVMLGMFTFMSRFEASNGAPLFGGDVTLATRVNQLTQGVRDNLTAAAESLALDSSGITGTTTLRQALKILGDQLSGIPFVFGQTVL